MTSGRQMNYDQVTSGCGLVKSLLLLLDILGIWTHV